MSTYPTQPRAAFVQWCETHAPVFSANAAAIGLASTQATGFATATAAVTSGLLAQQAALQAYRVATQVVEDGLRALRTAAGDSVRTIRAFAETQAKPSVVYNLAQIPPPAQPSPTPPPGSPTEFRIELLQTGPLKLMWKCRNPAGASGTMYEIMRRIGGGGEGGAFTYVGTTGTREFLDETLPAGAGSVTYQITATRSTSRGVPAQFTVNLGVTPAAGASVDDDPGETPMKNARHGAVSTVDGRAVRKVLLNTKGSLTQRRGVKT